MPNKTKLQRSLAQLTEIGEAQFVLVPRVLIPSNCGARAAPLQGELMSPITSERVVGWRDVR